MNTDKSTTSQYLERKRKQQDRAERNGDYTKVVDIIKEIEDFGLRDVYDR